MARDGIWSKKAKYGKYSALKFVYDNPGCKKNDFCNGNFRAFQNVQYHIDEGNIEFKYGSFYSLLITPKGINLLESLE